MTKNVPRCMCKDRLASECPGEWEPGCDLGNNEKYVAVSKQEPPAIEASDSTAGTVVPAEVQSLLRETSDYLAELYAKYQRKVGPFASQAQLLNVRIRALLAAAPAPRQNESETAAEPVAGLGRITQSDRFLEFEFDTEAAAGAFHARFAPSVDVRDMPEIAATTTPAPSADVVRERYTKWWQSLTPEQRYDFDSEGRGYKKDCGEMMRLAFAAGAALAAPGKEQP